MDSKKIDQVDQVNEPQVHSDPSDTDTNSDELLKLQDEITKQLQLMHEEQERLKFYLEKVLDHYTEI